MSKRVRFWVGILSSLVCVGLILWLVDIDLVVQALRGADWRVVLVVAAGQVGFLVLRALRWRVMLTGSDASAGFWPLFHAQNAGYMISSLFPFRLGDLARSYLASVNLGSSGIDMVKALSSVVLERVLDMLIIVVFFGISAPLAPSMPQELSTAALVVSVVTVVGFGLLLAAAVNRVRALELSGWALGKVSHPRLDPEAWLRRIDSFLGGLSSLTRWRSALPVVILSLLLWICIVAGYYWGLKGFWSEVTLPAALVALAATAFGVSVPSSPGFVGVFHGAVILGLSVFSVSREQALGFAFVYHAVSTYIVNVGLGAIGLWRSGQTLGAVVVASRELGTA